jgi:hypothetical protein
MRHADFLPEVDLTEAAAGDFESTKGGGEAAVDIEVVEDPAEAGLQVRERPTKEGAGISNFP